ncbi:hypothetical protein, partial [Piscirickettsia litoralis]|uniref:hypothetical protein n=1 Tax=Piscirickettsia litoralis TaxID=1891921 RepID=UPI001F23CB16
PLILIIIVSFVIQLHIILSNDVIWLMTATARLLSGGSYVQDFFETNPPLILYLYTPAYLLKQYLAIPEEYAVYILTFSIGIISLALSKPSIRKIFHGDTVSESILVLSLVVIYFMLPSYAFAEREHLMIMLVMPYVISLAVDYYSEKKTVRIFIGVCAGLGFCLKPYFIFAPVIFELYLFLKYRKFSLLIRAESIAVILVFLYICFRYIF